MSIALMTQVWNGCEDVKAESRLVLLALADCANDDGICWPRMGHLARKANITEDAARNIVGRLIDQSYLQIVEPGGGRGRGNTYCVTPVSDTRRAAKPPVQNGGFRREGLRETPGSETPVSQPSPIRMNRNYSKPPSTSSLRSDAPPATFSPALFSDTETAQAVSLVSENKTSPVSRKPGVIAAGNPVYLAVLEVCQVNLSLSSIGTKTHAARAAKSLLAEGHRQGLTEDEMVAGIRDFRRRWDVADFRGRRGEAPTPTQLCDKFEEIMTRTDLKPEITNGNHTTETTYRGTPTNATERHAAIYAERRATLRAGWIANGLDPRTCGTPGIFSEADYAEYDRGAWTGGGGGFRALHEAA